MRNAWGGWVLPGLFLALAGCGGVGGRIGPVDLGLVSSGVELLAAGATKIQRDDEVNIGRGVAARILAQYGAWHEPTLRQYVNLVGQTLVQSVGRDDITYHFTILNHDSVNAFSTPGGYIFITRGALRQMRDEAELAGVLGHEIAHVNLRHVLSEIENRYFARKAGETAMQALGAYGGRGGAATMTALQAGGPVFSQMADFATEVVFKGYGRTQEIEADKIGTEYAQRAGYHPYGLVSFLEASWERSQRKDEAVSGGLMRTHPIHAERIGELREHIRATLTGFEGLPRLTDRYALWTRGRI
ncbi:MAG TPA: M48 family metalloprotease [Candidatus Methylomirabilis sp.]